MTIINPERLVRDVVVVAASAGGLELILHLVGELPADLPAGVAIVLHRSPAGDGMLVSILQRKARMRVIEPQDHEPWAPGTIFVAPPDRHLVLRGKAFFRDAGPKERFTRPAADPLFRTAAAEFGERVVGIVLSGGDEDGAAGCIAVEAAGGITLAQDPDEAMHPSMPRSTILRDHVSAVLPIEGIIEAVVGLARGEEIRV
jgi:two-component system, chemotaxis family, protein-glutamate methylesterase/glutaminase